MNWRDVLFGAFVTLIVMVVGGVVVYYLTVGSPAEKLTYEVDKPVTFESGQTTMSVFNIRVKNDGNKAATNVTIGVEFDDIVKISDKRISLSSGPAGKVETQANGDNELKVDIAVLTPDEIATVAILTDTVDASDPTIGVKSAVSIGERATLNVATTGFATQAAVMRVLVPIALVAQVVLLMFMRHRVGRLLRRFFPAVRSINDTAFVLLHAGLTEQAIELLSKNISASGAEPLMLANYGLALGLGGDTAKSEKMLEAAEFWAATNSHEQAVIAFNRALLAFQQHDDASGIKLMRRAFEMSKNEITRYVSYSTIVATLREENPEVRSLLKGQGLAG